MSSHHNIFILPFESFKIRTGLDQCWSIQEQTFFGVSNYSNTLSHIKKKSMIIYQIEYLVKCETEIKNYMLKET